MTYKSILAPLTATGNADGVLAVATLVARRCESYVEGVAHNPPITDFISADMFAGGVLGTVETELTAAAKGAKEKFAAAMAAAGLAPAASPEQPGACHAWNDEPRASETFISTHARTFDLTVVERPGPNPSPRTIRLVESLIFESGRPMIVAPPGQPKTLAENILIAWNCSSETGLAVALAMPLLRTAKQVTILTVEGGTVEGPSGETLALRLARHGVKAAARTVKPTKSVGECVVSEAQSSGADLIIKGAYTQSRLRQMVFGGQTAHLLEAAPAPMFMAH